jgi:hypothetical protein
MFRREFFFCFSSLSFELIFLVWLFFGGNEMKYGDIQEVEYFEVE